MWRQLIIFIASSSFAIYLRRILLQTCTTTSTALVARLSLGYPLISRVMFSNSLKLNRKVTKTNARMIVAAMEQQSFHLFLLLSIQIRNNRKMVKLFKVTL